MVPQEEVLAVARAAAKTLANKPVGSMSATKRLMRDTAVLLARIEQEKLIFAERLKSDEALEALRAFAERRPPDFSRLTSLKGPF